jgi:hypothetical protein
LKIGTSKIELAGVVGLPETNDINGCDSVAGNSEPAKTAGNPAKCRTFPCAEPSHPTTGRQATEKPRLGLPLRQSLVLPSFAATLLLVLVGVLGVLFWPALSERSRKRRLGIMAALAGDDWAEYAFADSRKIRWCAFRLRASGCGPITAIAWAPDEGSPWCCLGTFRGPCGLSLVEAGAQTRGGL